MQRSWIQFSHDEKDSYSSEFITSTSPTPIVCFEDVRSVGIRQENN